MQPLGRSYCSTYLVKDTFKKIQIVGMDFKFVSCWLLEESVRFWGANHSGNMSLLQPCSNPPVSLREECVVVGITHQLPGNSQGAVSVQTDQLATTVQLV